MPLAPQPSLPFQTFPPHTPEQPLPSPPPFPPLPRSLLAWKDQCSSFLPACRGTGLQNKVGAPSCADQTFPCLAQDFNNTPRLMQGTCANPRSTQNCVLSVACFLKCCVHEIKLMKMCTLKICSHICKSHIFRIAYLQMLFTPSGSSKPAEVAYFQLWPL